MSKTQLCVIESFESKEEDMRSARLQSTVDAYLKRKLQAEEGREQGHS